MKSFDLTELRNADFNRGYEAGQQSQQSRIDELTKENKSLCKLVNYDTEQMEILHNNIDELKERISEAIEALEKSKPYMMKMEDAKAALSILRGEK